MTARSCSSAASSDATTSEWVANSPEGICATAPRSSGSVSTKTVAPAKIAGLMRPLSNSSTSGRSMSIRFETKIRSSVPDSRCPDRAASLSKATASGSDGDMTSSLSCHMFTERNTPSESVSNLTKPSWRAMSAKRCREGTYTGTPEARVAAQPGSGSSAAMTGGCGNTIRSAPACCSSARICPYRSSICAWLSRAGSMLRM